jgi:hypothetical protein
MVNKHVLTVSSFEALVSTPFRGDINAMAWMRQLAGDFAEIVGKLPAPEHLELLETDALCALELSPQGQMARETLLHDMQLLSQHGASPILNLITCYERDNAFPFFPTDVYGYHVDRASIPADTFLCTYHGAPSDILPNTQAEQKIQVPEIRAALQNLYGGSSEDGFEAFLEEHFFDLHYQPKLGAVATSLGIGNLWRLATDYPGSPVLPCVHRAPVEQAGQTRLLLIC